MPLVLKRSLHQTIEIDGPSVVRVNETRPGSVKLEVIASDDVRVLRGEVADAIRREVAAAESEGAVDAS